MKRIISILILGVLLLPLAASSLEKPPVTADVGKILRSVAKITIEELITRENTVIGDQKTIREFIGAMDLLERAKPCLCERRARLLLESRHGTLQVYAAAHTLDIYHRQPDGRWEKQGLFVMPEEFWKLLIDHLDRRKKGEANKNLDPRFALRLAGKPARLQPKAGQLRVR